MKLFRLEHSRVVTNSSGTGALFGRSEGLTTLAPGYLSHMSAVCTARKQDEIRHGRYRLMTASHFVQGTNKILFL